MVQNQQHSNISDDDKSNFQSRINTFSKHKWPYKIPDPEKLAEAGFYRIEDGEIKNDKCICYYCGLC